MELAFETDTNPFSAFIDRLVESVDVGREGSMREAAVNASDVFWDAMRKRFDESSARMGDWAEHAQSTIKRRGANAPILQETGVLRDSMDRSDPAHFVEVSGDGVVEGTGDRTARFHQDGTDRMPARPILAEPDSDTLDLIRDALADGIQRSVREAA